MNWSRVTWIRNIEKLIELLKSSKAPNSYYLKMSKLNIFSSIWLYVIFYIYTYIDINTLKKLQFYYYHIYPFIYKYFIYIGISTFS